MQSTTVSANLRGKIQDLRRQNSQNQTYVPILSLKALINRDVVCAELKLGNVKPYLLEEMTMKIITGAVAFFAILVSIGEIQLSQGLMERGQLQDSILPLSLEILKEFDITVALNFYKTQWEFLAPCLSRSMISKSLDSKTILPFSKDEKLGQGGFGTIYRISLDPDHQDLPEGFPSQLVRKELSYADSLIELENLAILSYLKHPNIIELLCSYRYGERCNLIFPFAEGGDLASLFRTKRAESPFQSDETLLIAIADLASALEHVHQFTHERLDLDFIGCHHDLRPRNILVSGRTLMLADFGLSRFKGAGEGSQTMFKIGTDSYLAPECEDLDTFEKSKIGRSSDIWSLGCILAEIAVYMAFGPQGVEEFKEDRAFKRGPVRFGYFHCGSEHNPAVEDWLSKLSDTGSRWMVEIVRLVKLILSLNAEERPKAKDITSGLRLIVISELAECISKLYDCILKTGESLEGFLQRRRFLAWQYGLGIIDQRSGSATENGIMSSNLKFNSTVQYLNEIRDCLQSISRSTKEVSSSAFRDLARWNDCLANLLDENQQDRARVYLSSAILESQFSGPISKSQDAVTILNFDRKIRMLAALKIMTELTTKHAGQDTDGRQIQANLVRNLKPFGNHHVGILSGSRVDQSVLVEWRTYGRQKGDDTVSHELFTRLERITELLSLEKPEGFRSLLCRGFFHDVGQCRFGVVYDLSMHHFPDHDGVPMTLQSLINKTKSISEQPLLEDKFNLALLLAKALLEFHLIGWLHKDLTSANIIFCSRDTVPPLEVVRHPYIIGFSHSRPDEAAAFTAGPATPKNNYQHPKYQQEGDEYRQQYDYYSLGILLLEIGYWATIGKWEGDWTKQMKRSMSAEEISGKLLKSRAPFIGTAMGSAYRDAVIACLTGNFGIHEPFKDEKERKVALQLGFQRSVVDRLRQRLA